MARAQVTTSHNKIKKWAESRGGHPADVKGTGGKSDAGILRIDFGPPEEKLEEISWEEFFEKFDEAELAFLYQDKTASGEPSRFHKFVSRDTVEDEEEEDEDEDDEDEDLDEDDDEDDEDDDDDDEDGDEED